MVNGVALDSSMAGCTAEKIYYENNLEAKTESLRIRDLLENFNEKNYESNTLMIYVRIDSNYRFLRELLLDI